MAALDGFTLSIMQSFVSSAAIFAAGLLLSIQSCTRIPLDQIEETEQVHFRRDIKPLMVNYCLKCHSHKQDFSQYKNSFELKKQIYQKIVVDRTPHVTQMSDEERALIRDWIDQGGNR